MNYAHNDVPLRIVSVANLWKVKDKLPLEHTKRQ